MVFGLENGLTVNKNLWNGDHVWQSVQLYVGGKQQTWPLFEHDNLKAIRLESSH